MSGQGEALTAKHLIEALALSVSTPPFDVPEEFLRERLAAIEAAAAREALGMNRLRAIERAAIALVVNDTVDNFNALCDAVGVGDEPSEPGQ